MPKIRSFARYWLPVLIWMIVIFSASADTDSSGRTSRIIGPIVRWLFPDISDPAFDLVVLITRKWAHLVEYAILALLLWRAFRRPVKADPRPWNWPLAGRVILLAALYAATDECHQIFVRSRYGAVLDVLIDTVGAAAGILLLWAVGRRRQRRSREVTP